MVDLNASGVLVIDKAPDMTSHDVVAIARRSLGIKKIGHCGTLDPMATGLIVLVINKATKLQDLLMGEDKEYEGTLTFGSVTSSYDRTGEVIESHEVPDFTPDELKSAFDKYMGNFDQIPPMVSAIKKDGVPLYKLARKGQTIEREPRAVYVKDYEFGRIELPDVDFVVRCSKGFYVRSYVHDIGQDLGCGAHLSALRRTRSGFFNLDKAITIETLKNAPREELWQSLIGLEEILSLRK